MTFIRVDKAVAGYGYIDGEVGRDDVVEIVRRGKTNPQEPEYDFLTKLSSNKSHLEYQE